MKALITSAFCILTSAFILAQTQLKTPEVSQLASVTQRIGLTDITVNYHSPIAKNRVIWGDLVPYNEVWRAGANENTTIAFTTDVKIEGKPLAAGTYGLHMIPTEKTWTIIFSKNNYAWGSFFYKESEDALRVTVTPNTAPMQEWLSYTFADPQAGSVKATLHWEKLEVPFKIEVDVPETVYQSMKKELSNLNGFFWEGYNQAAAYCVRNNIHLDDAATWIDKSIRLQKTFPNLTTKARLLEKQGKAAEAETLRKEAMSLANEAQLNAYGYDLMGQGKTAEAIAIFKENTKRYPNSWNTYDSLGEAQEASGDKKGAAESYKTALAKAPEGQKKRIEGILKKIEGK